MTRPSLLVLLLALLVYAAFRAAVLTWSFDGVAIPNYELFMGNIAVVAENGWFGPPLHQYYDNCGGHLATGVFAWPLFELFGETYLSLKLVPVLLGAATLVLVHSILRRHVGPVAAAVGALAFALGPPTLAKYSMLAKGNHFENLAFQFAMVACFYRMHTASEERKRLWLVAFGVASGFAIFFYFGSLAMLALLSLVHLAVRGPLGVLRDLRLAVPALLVGLSPLVWVFVSANARPGNFLDAKLGGGSGRSLDQALGRLEALWTDLLPRAGCFEDLGPVPAVWGERLYLVAFALAWVSLLPATVRGIGGCLRGRGNTTERERFEGLVTAPFVLFLPFFSLLFSASSFDFDAYAPPVEIGQFRYLVPHFAFATVLFGMAVGRHLQSEVQGRRWLGGGILVLLFGSQLFSLPIVAEPLSVPGVATRYDGYDFVYENNVLMRDSVPDPQTGAPSWDMQAMVQDLADFPAEHRERALLGVGYYLAWAQTLPGSPKAPAPRAPGIVLEEITIHFPTDFQPHVLRGVGAFLRTPIGNRKAAQAKLDRFLAPLLEANAPLLPWVLDGLSASSEFPLARRTRELLDQAVWLGGRLPAEHRGSWSRGLGRSLAELAVRGVPGDLVEVQACLERIEPGDDLWFGFGFGLEWSLDGLPAEFELLVPEEGRSAALQGLGAGVIQRYAAETAGELFKRIRGELSEADRESLELGLRWEDRPRAYRF